MKGLAPYYAKVETIDEQFFVDYPVIDGEFMISATTKGKTFYSISTVQ